MQSSNKYLRHTIFPFAEIKATVGGWLAHQSLVVLVLGTHLPNNKASVLISLNKQRRQGFTVEYNELQKNMSLKLRQWDKWENEKKDHICNSICTGIFSIYIVRRNLKLIWVPCIYYLKFVKQIIMFI